MVQVCNKYVTGMLQVFFFRATLTDLTLASKRPMKTMGPTEAQLFAPSPIFQDEQAGTIAEQWQLGWGRPSEDGLP